MGKRVVQIRLEGKSAAIHYPVNYYVACTIAWVRPGREELARRADEEGAEGIGKSQREPWGRGASAGR